MASGIHNNHSGKGLTFTVGLWLCAIAASVPSLGEAAVLRLPALCDLSLEELLTIGILPGEATDRAPIMVWPHPAHPATPYPTLPEAR